MADTRRRLYMGLAAFVLLAGLPLAVVPQLRARLFERAAALRAALTGEPVPALATVGGAPYPREFELPPSPPEPPEAAQAASAAPPFRVAAPATAPEDTAPAGARGRPVLVPRDREQPRKAPPLIRERPGDAPPPEPEADGLPYRQGEVERQAYDLVLKSNKALAAMVAGDKPGVKFRRWDAAHRGEDAYWVRVSFDGPDGAEEYIWQVRLSLGEITPLSFNARTLS